MLGRTFDDDPPILGHGISDATVDITPDESPEIVTAPGSHYAIARIQRGNDARMRIYAAPIDAIRDSTTAWRPIAPSYDDQYIGSDNVDIPVVALTGDALYWLSRKDSPRGEILKLDLARAASKPEVIVPQGDLPISTVYAGRDAIYWRVSDAGVNSIHRLRFARGAQPETLHLPYAANVVRVFPDPLTDAAVILVSSWLRAPAYLSVNARTVATAANDLQPAGPDDHPEDLVAEEVKIKSWDGRLCPCRSCIAREQSSTATIQPSSAVTVLMAPRPRRSTFPCGAAGSSTATFGPRVTFAVVASTAVIVYAGANDHRAEPWIPAKFAARLQAATANGKPVLLRMDYDAGHTGFDATRAQGDKDTADMFAFAQWQTGDPDFQPGRP